jgi:hypothetical protein
MKLILKRNLLHCQGHFDGFVGVQSEALLCMAKQSFALNSNRTYYTVKAILTGS